MIIVERFVLLAKPGCEEELEALVAASMESAPECSSRLYRTHTGVRHTLINEIEFENWEEREKFWVVWADWASPEGFMEKVTQLLAPGGLTCELLWRVA